jgi:hypothetical protein
MMGWAGTKQTSAIAAPFILVNSIAGLAGGFSMKSAGLPPQVAILAIAVVIGGWLGAEYGSRRFANPLVRRILAVVLAAAGGKMMLA